MFYFLKIVDIPNWLEMVTVMMKPIIYIVTLTEVIVVIHALAPNFVLNVNVSLEMLG